MKNNYTKISFIYFTSMCLVGVVFLLGYLGVLKNEVLSSVLIQIIVMFAIPLILYTLLVSKNLKKTFVDCGFKKISGKILIISIILGICLYIINSYISTAFASIISMFGYETLPLNSTGSTQTITYGLLFKEFLLSAVLPGICEEFLHRGIMLSAGKKYANPKFCLFISSLLFGLMHLNINQFFYAAIMGVLMGIVCLVSESIYPTIIIHFMNNFLSNYFYYGSKLNLPFANLVLNIEQFLFSNFVGLMIVVPMIIMLLIFTYIKLVDMIRKEQVRLKVKKLFSALKQTDLPVEQMQIKINEINNILSNKQQTSNIKLNFSNKVFVICSVVFGSLITISTFIWGII